MKITDLPSEVDNLHLGATLIPGNEKLKNGKTILQVGARPGPGWIQVFNCFKQHGYDTFHVLEIHEPNIKWLREQKNFPLDLIVHGDIREIDKYDDLLDKYDVVIFWHGWEHCTKEEANVAMPKVLAKCNIAHIAGMPWGKWEQGAIKSNPHEKHVMHWLTSDLETFGFNECYTFNAAVNGPGPDKHNVMYGVKYV